MSAIPFDHEFLDLGADAEAELVEGVGERGLADVLVAGGAFFDLFEEQPVFVGEVRAVPFVEALDDLGERLLLLLWVACAHSCRARHGRGFFFVDGDRAGRNLLEAVVLQLHVAAEADRATVGAGVQVREQCPSVGGEPLEVAVAVGDDLAEERVEANERA